MTILLTSLAAAIAGIGLFWFIIPRTAHLLAKVVEKSLRIDGFQKIRILNYLDNLYSGPLQNQVKRNSYLLVGVFLVLLVLQHYFLFAGNSGGARIVVTGMFILLVAHVACE